MFRINVFHKKYNFRAHKNIELIIQPKPGDILDLGGNLPKVKVERTYGDFEIDAIIVENISKATCNNLFEKEDWACYG